MAKFRVSHEVQAEFEQLIGIHGISWRVVVDDKGQRRLLVEISDEELDRATLGKTDQLRVTKPAPRPGGGEFCLRFLEGEQIIVVHQEPTTEREAASHA